MLHRMLKRSHSNYMERQEIVYTALSNLSTKQIQRNGMTTKKIKEGSLGIKIS